MALKHKPRGDFVLVRRIVHGQTPSGIQVAEQSEEGTEFRVVAAGPKVTDLKNGDKVLCVASEGSFMFLPNDRDLFVTREANIVLTYG